MSVRLRECIYCGQPTWAKGEPPTCEAHRQLPSKDPTYRADSDAPISRSQRRERVEGKPPPPR